MGADRLILVDGSRETGKVVEQKENPVAPGLKRVQPVMKVRKRLDLPEKFEMGTSNAIGVFGDDFDADSSEQIGAEGHDVAAHVERLCVVGKCVANTGTSTCFRLDWWVT